MARQMECRVRGAASLVEDSLGAFGLAAIQRLSAGNPGSSNVFSLTELKSKQGIDGVDGPRCQSRWGSIWVGIEFGCRGLDYSKLFKVRGKPFCLPELDAALCKLLVVLGPRKHSLDRDTNHGIYCVRGRKVDRFYSADGLSSDSVNRFYEDREGNLWVFDNQGH